MARAAPARAAATRRARRWRLLFGLCYAMSGAAGLIYQVVWMRLLALELGHTVAASTTVLAAFMGGLCVGAGLAARFVPAAAHRLRAYAGLEVAVAVMAIALPAVLAAFQPLLVWAYADGYAPIGFALARVGLGLFLVGVPACALGATFPIAAAWLADMTAAQDPVRSRVAVDVAFVYAANTAGAAFGAMAAGFWLIPAFGLRATTGIAVILSLGAGATAWRLAGAQEAGAGAVRQRHAATSPRRDLRQPPAVAPRRRRLAYAAAALSGYTGLAYEVAWTRLLALVVGPTTYAFATMVAAVVTGIAIGSALTARYSRRIHDPALWLAATLVASALGAPLAAWFTASRLPLIVAYDLASGASGESILVREAISVFLLLVPIGILLGAAFTLAVAMAAPSAATVERETARVYIANTTGAVLGALAAGFLLIERVGLQATIVGTSRVSALGAIAMLGLVLASGRFTTRPARVAIAGGSLVAAALALLLQPPPWDRELLASGAYKYAQALGVDELEARLRAGTLEYYREGAAATVSVREFAGTRSLSIDGKVDASNAADMLTQRLLGALPVLLHSNPERLLVIGLGSGVTVGSALASGAVRRADVVEISPQVVEASGFFAAENDGVLRSPALRLIVGDGRSHLRLTTQTYDVIVPEPSNPWMAGVASLFTREFFESARARLRPDGLLCQWAHTYEMTRADVASIVATFRAVFPQGAMWLVGEGDLLLIGTAGADIESRLGGVAERWNIGRFPALWRSLGMGSSAPFVVLSQFVGGPAVMAAFAADALLQTDDRMTLEYTAPRAMYARSSDATDLLARASGPPPPAVSAALAAATSRDWTARGETALKAETHATADESFRRAVAMDPWNADALRGVSDAAVQARGVDDARRWLAELARQHPGSAPLRIELSRLLAASGDAPGAISAALDAMGIDAAGPRPVEQLASIYEDLGDGERLAAVADELMARFPDRDSGTYYRAAALLARGRHAEAIAAARLVLSANPRHARAHNLLGVACAAAAQLRCARAAFETAVRLTPRDPSPYTNLGLVHLQSADAPSAVGYFADAIALDPSAAAAREGLAQARAATARR